MHSTAKATHHYWLGFSAVSVSVSGRRGGQWWSVSVSIGVKAAACAAALNSTNSSSSVDGLPVIYSPTPICCAVLSAVLNGRTTHALGVIGEERRRKA